MAANVRTSPYQKYLLDIMSLYKTRSDLKAYTEFLLSLARIGIFLIFAIKPTLVTIATLITKINTEQQTADQMDTKIKNLGTAQNLFNAQKAKIDLLVQAVPKGADAATYVRQIEGLIKKDNLTMVTLSINEIDLKEGKSPMVVVATVTGTYDQLIAFLKDVENLRRPAVLVKLNFAVSQLEAGSKSLNLTITPNTPFD